MKVIGAYEAKTHFSKLISEVAKGEKIMITKNGQALAMLVPVEQECVLSHEQACDRMRAFRQRKSKEKISMVEIIKMKDEGKK